MSDAAAATRTYLLTQSGVTDLVSTRIYFDVLPQNVTLPAIVVTNTGMTVARSTNAADSLRRKSVHVECYAASHANANAIGDAAETAMEFVTGTWGSVTVRRAFVEAAVDGVVSPNDGSESWRYVRVLSCVVWHI